MQVIDLIVNLSSLYVFLLQYNFLDHVFVICCLENLTFAWSCAGLLCKLTFIFFRCNSHISQSNQQPMDIQIITLHFFLFH